MNFNETTYLWTKIIPLILLFDKCNQGLSRKEMVISAYL